MNRKITGFWWVWREHDEWPSWYYDGKTAEEAAQRLARGSPGRKVLLGNLKTVKTILLPDRLEVT